MCVTAFVPLFTPAALNQSSASRPDALLENGHWFRPGPYDRWACVVDEMSTFEFN